MHSQWDEVVCKQSPSLTERANCLRWFEALKSHLSLQAHLAYFTRESEPTTARANKPIPASRIELWRMLKRQDTARPMSKTAATLKNLERSGRYYIRVPDQSWVFQCAGFCDNYRKESLARRGQGGYLRWKLAGRLQVSVCEYDGQFYLPMFVYLRKVEYAITRGALSILV